MGACPAEAGDQLGAALSKKFPGQGNSRSAAKREHSRTRCMRDLRNQRNHFFINGGVPVPLCWPMRRLAFCSKGSLVSPRGWARPSRRCPADFFLFWLFTLCGPRRFLAAINPHFSFLLRRYPGHDRTCKTGYRRTDPVYRVWHIIFLTCFCARIAALNCRPSNKYIAAGIVGSRPVAKFVGSKFQCVVDSAQHLPSAKSNSAGTLTVICHSRRDTISLRRSRFP